MEYEYIMVVVILILIVWFINVKRKSDTSNTSGVVELEPPLLELPRGYSSRDEFADSDGSGFDPNDTNSRWNSAGLGSGAPQLSETEIDTPEYKKQMAALIAYMLKAGHKKKIVNDYVNHIKEKFISPQLILMQFKNNVNAELSSVSEEMPTG